MYECGTCCQLFKSPSNRREHKQKVHNVLLECSGKQKFKTPRSFANYRSKTKHKLKKQVVLVRGVKNVGMQKSVKKELCNMNQEKGKLHIKGKDENSNNSGAIVNGGFTNIEVVTKNELEELSSDVKLQANVECKSKPVKDQICVVAEVYTMASPNGCNTGRNEDNVGDDTWDRNDEHLHSNESEEGDPTFIPGIERSIEKSDKEDLPDVNVVCRRKSRRKIPRINYEQLLGLQEDEFSFLDNDLY